MARPYALSSASYLIFWLSNLVYLLLPLASVKLLESFVAQEFELLVGLVKFSGNQFFICGVTLSNSILGVGLVPLGVAVNGLESEKG
jgi:hypothetical protein